MRSSQESRSTHRREVAASILLFALVFAVYASSRVITSSDSRWTLHVAMSIIKEGDVALDEYSEVIAKNDEAAITYADGRPYNRFPLGTPLLVTPIVLVIDRIAHHVWSVDLYARLQESRDVLVRGIEMYIACFLVALVCVQIYLIARQFMDRKRSLLLALVFAFCTSAWSTASRALWSHGPSMLMLSASLLLLLKARAKPSLAQYVSIPLACAYIIRPTNSVSAVLLTVYVLVKYPRYLVRYMCYAAALATPFIAHNLHVYHQVLPPYYLPERLGTNPRIVDALIGNLISPARGLLIYSPILLFAGYGLALKTRRSQFELLDGLLLAAVFLHWLVISTLWRWWGGGSFGPRLFTDMLPYLTYFLVPVLQEMTGPANRWRALSIAVFSALAATSLFMHFRGGTQPVVHRWNQATAYIAANVDDDRARLWDWSDPQFWRGLRPAKVSVEPPVSCLRTAQGRRHDLTFTVINAGDKPFTCQVSGPKGVVLLATPGEIPGLGNDRLSIAVNAADYGPGMHSLGGMYIDGLSADGRPLKGCSLVVPLGLQIPPSPDPRGSTPQAMEAANETYIPFLATPQSSALLRTYVPPKDILVNGQAQMTTSDQIRAIYGAGWYRIESSEDRRWRWAESPAEVYICSPVTQRATLVSTPIALHEEGEPRGVGEQGTLLVTTNGRLDASFIARAKEPFAVEADLQAGWNVITMELEAGNFRPVDVDPVSGDRRSLSFALRDLDLRLK